MMFPPEIKDYNEYLDEVKWYGSVYRYRSFRHHDWRQVW
jgi:hypothetical protein